MEDGLCYHHYFPQRFSTFCPPQQSKDWVEFLKENSDLIGDFGTPHSGKISVDDGQLAVDKCKFVWKQRDDISTFIKSHCLMLALKAINQGESIFVYIPSKRVDLQLIPIKFLENYGWIFQRNLSYISNTLDGRKTMLTFMLESNKALVGRQVVPENV